MTLFDPDIKLYGPNSIIGRSIVLEQEDGDYIDCCTIHIDNGSPQVAAPILPTWTPSTSTAECTFPDGRFVTFAQLNEYTGLDSSANDYRGDHSVGSRIEVNPETVFISATTMTLPISQRFRQKTGGSPVLLGCGTTGQTPIIRPAWTEETYLDFPISHTRMFRELSISLDFWFEGTWVSGDLVCTQNHIFSPY